MSGLPEINAKTAPPEVKGWCPGALRPMLSGDGWVVRIRPPLGRLSQSQAAGIADLADAHGNGMLDLSNRANLQIRGVTKASHAPLIDGLKAHGLVDTSATAEARRNIIVTPFADDDAYQFAALLSDALAEWEGPEMPGKFGFAIDTGPVPVLRGSPADIRLERDAMGGLLICAEGCDLGQAVEDGLAVTAMIALARDGLNSGSGSRMRKLLVNGFNLSARFSVQRQQVEHASVPGAVAQGFLTALAFGQIQAKTLRDLSHLGGLRMTPWRMVLIENLKEPPMLADMITAPDDPLRRVVACTGAPSCTQAFAAVRPIARALAPRVPKGKILHVSGCSKGCAHPRVAALTVVAAHDGFNFAANALASDTPDRWRLRPEDLSELI